MMTELLGYGPFAPNPTYDAPVFGRYASLTKVPVIRS